MQPQTEKQSMSNAVDSCEQPIVEFVTELSAFRGVLKKKIPNYPESELITAFAIFRKGKRTDKINNNRNFKDNSNTLTEKQKKCIYALISKSKIGKMSNEEIAALTKAQASGLISKADEKSSASSLSEEEVR